MSFARFWLAKGDLRCMLLGETFRERAMKLKGTILFSTALGAAAILMTAHFAQSQPPAAPGASGGRGGGRALGGARAFDYSDNEGWMKIFDGSTMNGWAGNTKFWSVKDDSLYIHPSCEQPTGTTYIY